MINHSKIINQKFYKRFIDYLYKIKFKGIDWNSFKLNWAFPLEFVIENRELFGNIEFINYHSGLDIDFIKKHPNVTYDWCYLSTHINIKKDSFILYKHLPWITEYLPWNYPDNLNNNDFILKYFEYKNSLKVPSFEYLMNLCIDNLEQNTKNIIHVLDIYYGKEKNLIYKKFDVNDTKLIENHPFQIEYFFEKVNYYAKIIQNWWREIILNPYHPIGDNYINKKYDLIQLNKIV